MRLPIEPAIARLAARRRKRSPLAESYLERMVAARDIDDRAQQELWSECDRRFHRELAVMTEDASRATSPATSEAAAAAAR